MDVLSLHRVPGAWMSSPCTECLVRGCPLPAQSAWCVDVLSLHRVPGAWMSSPCTECLVRGCPLPAQSAWCVDVLSLHRVPVECLVHGCPLPAQRECLVHGQGEVLSESEGHLGTMMIMSKVVSCLFSWRHAF